jgi:hypothetical protein
MNTLKNYYIYEVCKIDIEINVYTVPSQHLLADHL